MRAANTVYTYTATMLENSGHIAPILISSSSMLPPFYLLEFCNDSLRVHTHKTRQVLYMSSMASSHSPHTHMKFCSLSPNLHPHASSVTARRKHLLPMCKHPGTPSPRQLTTIRAHHSSSPVRSMTSDRFFAHDGQSSASAAQLAPIEKRRTSCHPSRVILALIVARLLLSGTQEQ
jgi:hypothetical protein